MFVKEIYDLTEWKYVSAMSAMYDNPDYEFQLNALAVLVKNVLGWKVSSLQNVKLFRHLDKSKMSMGGYPQENAMWVPIPMWSVEKTKAEIENRVRRHIASSHLNDNELPECTDDEKWQRGETIKVYEKLKSGERFKKTASFSGSREEANEYVSKKKLFDNQYLIKKIKGRPIRCLDFCPIKDFCNQHQEYLVSLERE